VDLLTWESLTNPYLRHEIESTQEPLYAAQLIALSSDLLDSSDSIFKWTSGMSQEDYEKNELG
jgi:hypothetical protein